jgi:LuxR family maltose regulon positive regulatory protein
VPRPQLTSDGVNRAESRAAPIFSAGAYGVPLVQSRATVIRGKLATPPLPERLVSRPRLVRLVSALIDEHRVLVVSATAGAGKTTAVVEAVRSLERPIAWLTLDATDAAPGRLVTYLEAALAGVRPAVSGLATDALTAGIPHAEAAGLLAEGIGAEPAVLVVDDLERIAESRPALAVLETFIRYAPRAMRIVLVSRRDVQLDIGGGLLGAIREDDLAFTASEATQALARLGRSDVDPVHALRMTGGWVTGVLFEAWSAADHTVGLGGEADPLHGYLATQILARLSPEERDFLVETSVLDRVTAAGAEGLGLDAARDRLGALRGQHLPATWDAGGRGMRCHPRFREYLLECLERRGDHRVRALRAAHGRMLAREGDHEAATEELLRAGALGEAHASAEEAIEPVIDRLDFEVADRWLAALGDGANDASGSLAGAELMVAVGQEQYRRGARIADRLAAGGERERRASESPRTAATIAWCYFHVGRLDDAHAVLAVARDSADVAAARYLLALADPGGGHVPPPALAGTALDALVMRVHSIRGHLSALTDPPASRWAQAVMAPWRISALRATGHTERALELLQSGRDGGSAGVGLHAIVVVEIMIDLGRRDEALAALRRGRDLVRRSGSVVFGMQSMVAEAKLELRLAGDLRSARAILDRLWRETPLDEYRYVRETADTWYGLVLLREGHDEDARARLERAVASMRGADRLLELPTAAVYLAEAAWRTDDEAAADAAADLALDAARRQGSNHLLLQALSDFPAVLTRRLDAEPVPDSPWHELGRALRRRSVTVPARAETVVELREFGEVSALVNGERVCPRLTKSYELLAYLALQHGAAPRDDLLDALFAGRTDASARAYLRQAIHVLRGVLPSEVCLEVVDGRVRLADGVRIVSESARFEALLAEAAELLGEERLEATLRALELVDRGEYLPGRSSPWIDARDEHLRSLTADARFEAGQLAFAAGRYQLSERLVERVVAADPFREGAWRLIMQIAGAHGDDDGMIGAYRRCERTLATLGTSPATSTRQLLDRLRR